MAKKGLLINYGWCSGCQSCEIACRNEHDFPLDRYGIKVLELGPFEVDKADMPTGIDWSYIPTPTTLCDLCADRVEAGGIPTCQLHCLANVIQYGDVGELAAQLKDDDDQYFLIVP